MYDYNYYHILVLNLNIILEPVLENSVQSVDVYSLVTAVRLYGTLTARQRRNSLIVPLKT